VPINTTHLPYRETGYFSSLAGDYLEGNEKLRCCYDLNPDEKGIETAIRQRSQFPVNRRLLVEILERQYTDLPKSTLLSRNISLLKEENTFTVCTAHQPNLMTGYLYFVYKIMHAVKLAESLQAQHPDLHFVPVYYMGSEDNDLDELGTFRFGDQKFTWDGNGQKGAVGRMATRGLKPLLESLFRIMGPPGENTETLVSMLSEAYLNHATISEATRYLVNELFGRYGLVVLDPDEPGFKQAILPLLKDELLHQSAYPIVKQQTEQLAVHYKTQAYPRPVNLFYLHDQLRERIEKKGAEWVVVNTGISWTEEELMDELGTHPERFSPNVILRGLLQESILPDVAFIGGGAEVAYWMQLMPVFRHYQVFYPVILLRQSVLWIPAKAAALRKKLSFDIKDLFRSAEELSRRFIEANSGEDWHTSAESGMIAQALKQLKQKAGALDPTLEASADAALARIQKQLEALEQKMYRAEKRKMDDHLQHIRKLRALLFPGENLQERSDNFLSMFLQYGFGYFDLLKEKIQPLKNEFLVIEETPA